ncbi:MAG: cation:proton antiporter [Gemmatimonadota bacterium]
MDVFTAAPHSDILVLVVQVGILLLVARALGEVAQRLGQPSVVGEILAGIVLGPSLLSGFVPVLGQWILPQTELQGYLLEVVSLIGVMFLLLITGLETDLRLIKRHARTALSVSWGGIAVTFGTGFLLGQHLPDFLLVDPDQRLVFSLFVGTALSISAIPVIAKVLMDLNLIRRDVGQTILAAGMSDDTIGWIMLSTVAGIAAGDAVTAGSVATTVGSVLLFLGLSVTLGQWLLRKVFGWVQDEIVSRDRLLTLVVVTAFAFGAISQALHLEAILGAFVAGIIFGQMPRLPQEVHQRLESMTLGIFAPIFFAVAGLKVNVHALLTPTLIGITLLVIAIATLGKVAGTYLGARLGGGKDHWTALSFGAGLNARGAMEIIIATVGLSLGVLTQDMFSVIVVMAIATSLMAPFALRWVLQRVAVTDEEAARLMQEEFAKGSLVAGIHRVLLPVRLQEETEGPIQAVEKQILQKLHQRNHLSITLLTVVSSEEERLQAQLFQQELRKSFTEAEIVTKVVVGDAHRKVILNEAAKDYHLLVIGASRREEERREVLFSHLVDWVVRNAPCPTLVVQGKQVDKDWSPRRVLVPTNGSENSKNAAELAFYMNERGKDEVIVVNVVDEQEAEGYHGLPVPQRTHERRVAIAQEIVEELRSMGESMGVLTDADVRTSTSPEKGILDTAKVKAADLIVLGTGVRPGSDRLFLGPRVERILAESECPVVVLNA